MSQQLQTPQVQNLLRGASVLACGGGLSFAEQTILTQAPRLRSALENGIPLLDPSELASDDVCITISEVGSAAAPVMDKSLLPEALKLFEQKTGKKVVAIIPGEIGQESIMLESAVVLGLPIVDADLSGCRAVPRLTDLALVVRGIPFTMSPLVVMTRKGKLTFVKQQKQLADDESKVRSLVPAGDVVMLLGGAVTGAMIQEFLAYASYSVAMRLGEALRRRDDLESVLPTECLFGPVDVTITDSKEVQADGFDQKILTLAFGKKTATLDVENEYMKLSIGKQQFAFPQLIMLVDSQQGRGLHSSELKKGQVATLLVADAFDFWKGKEV